MTANAAINATTGDFSSVFTTSALGVSASPYTISYSFAGNTGFAAANATTTLTVTKATPTIGFTAPTITFGTPTTSLSGQISAGTVIPSGTVAITFNGVIANATINATTGAFSCGLHNRGLFVSASPYAISYSFAGNTNFAAASATTALTVAKATPTITWAAPANITVRHGARVDPARRHRLGAGLVHLHAACRHRPAGGPGQVLSTTFTPTDTTDYTTATGSTTINVLTRDAHLQRAVRADDYLRHRHDHPLGDDHRRHTHSDRQRRDHPGRRDRECGDQRGDRRFLLGLHDLALGVGASPYTISYSFAGNTTSPRRAPPPR